MTSVCSVSGLTHREKPCLAHARDQTILELRDRRSIDDSLKGQENMKWHSIYEQ